jgi:hypothetical protein
MVLPEEPMVNMATRRFPAAMDAGAVVVVVADVPATPLFPVVEDTTETGKSYPPDTLT